MKLSILEPGQLSIFDIPIQVPEPKKREFVKTKEVIKENQELKIINTIKYKSHELTEAQKDVVNKFKTSISLNKIIDLHNGYLAVVLKKSTLEFATILYNRTGKEELRINDNIPILPSDRILFSKSNIPILYKPQEKQLKILNNKYPSAIEIRRKGDSNVILITNDRTISINPKGWILEFTRLKPIYEEEDKIINLKQEILDRNFEVGNKVEIMYGDRTYTGEIVYKYEDKEAFNISFDGKRTAFHVSTILRKVS